MDNLENVIQGLTNCTQPKEGTWCICTMPVTCPYIDAEDCEECEWHLMSDALSLIHAQQERIKALEAAQQPRVMTLEEVKAMPKYTVCAVESKAIRTTFNAEYRGIAKIAADDFLDFGLFADVSPFRRTAAGYGKTWRCWTSRPTDEQREVTAWI